MSIIPDDELTAPAMVEAEFELRFTLPEARRIIGVYRELVRMTGDEHIARRELGMELEAYFMRQVPDYVNGVDDVVAACQDFIEEQDGER